MVVRRTMRKVKHLACVKQMRDAYKILVSKVKGREVSDSEMQIRG
jgi:hypothetical protein